MAGKSEILQDLINDEQKTMHTICTHVASGGSLIDLCEVWGVEFGAISSWLRNDDTRNKRWQEAQLDRNEWVRETLLTELKKLSKSDLKKVVADDGSLLPVKDWPPEMSAAISSLEIVEEFEGKGKDKVQTGWNKKIKLWNKEKSLELLGKSISYFTENVKHSGTVTLEDIIAKSREPDEQS
jgi:hypothetical protein